MAEHSDGVQVSVHRFSLGNDRLYTAPGASKSPQFAENQRKNGEIMALNSKVKMHCFQTPRGNPWRNLGNFAKLCHEAGVLCLWPLLSNKLKPRNACSALGATLREQ
ncbi:MAG: hypothetical protein N4A70_03765 [Pelagimonas sp.]|jgi:hypothetical protein|nr:hypothetical protein [Pelagimonas sp.]